MSIARRMILQPGTDRRGHDGGKGGAGVHVIISSYANPLYSGRLNGWRTSTFNTVDRGGNRKTEVAWFSYEKPAALHDPRFVGGNKTRRVTVKRRADTWAAGLKRMPPHERQRVFEQLCEAMGLPAAVVAESCNDAGGVACSRSDGHPQA